MARNRRRPQAPIMLGDMPEPVKLNGGHLDYGFSGDGRPRMVDRDYQDPMDATKGGDLGGNRGTKREQFLARKGVF